MYKEIKISISQVREASGDRLISPEKIYALCQDIGDNAQEMFLVLTLNTKNRLIDRHMVSLGTVNSSLVSPREVFRPGITDGASSIIILHNHPSGDPSPSSDDIKITKKLIEAGRILEIPVVDHVIIGRGLSPFMSLRETGLCVF